MTAHTTHTEALQAAAQEVRARAVVSGSSRPTATPLPERRRVTSSTLLGDEREIEIEHFGQLYRLRLTSLGKLILTK